MAWEKIMLSTHLPTWWYTSSGHTKKTARQAGFGAGWGTPLPGVEKAHTGQRVRPQRENLKVRRKKPESGDFCFSTKRLSVRLESSNPFILNGLWWRITVNPSPCGWHPKGYRLPVELDLHINIWVVRALEQRNVGLFPDVRGFARACAVSQGFVGQQRTYQWTTFFIKL